MRPFRLFPGRALRLIAWSALLALVPESSASQSLQLLTTVVNIAVPAGAYNATTGKAEVTVPRGLVLQIQSTNSWRLKLRAVRSYFVNQSVPGDTKPVSDLQLLNVDGGSIFVPSVSSVEIARGGNTHGWVEHAFDVIFQATTDDPAGLYSVKLEFNLL
ncbi:MAG: hypothetical protein KAY59_12515 [Acidobacteria bacterium]|nr:hypothetical protein [Acidobacteriota bacterium]